MKGWPGEQVFALIVCGMLGYLSALVLRSFIRTAIAGLLFLAVLILASLMGITLFSPESLSLKILEVLRTIPSLKEIVAGLLELPVNSLLAVGYLVGLFIGLIGLRSFV